MSEINCYGNEVIYNEVIPGWWLVQLTNCIDKEYKVNGFVMKEGDFGLTYFNDPDFIFSIPPMLKPKESELFKTYKVYDSEEKLYYKTLAHYHERLCCNVTTGYKFYTDCINAGYTPQENKCKEQLAAWLLPKIYESYQKGKIHVKSKEK